ncbi:thiolase family protein [Sphingomonas immobilis]|uniref:Thiolase family protein n=1 Tax=Sphingomonas immobilis TaxID=3063997 RepID=A0ABT9A049_9SPHN|nr:thiolase family protein [Sphingomonas sp. CA1-15]MDO7842077.1 thiolase family protein [Sphingomonas sp. CA1-15]
MTGATITGIGMSKLGRNLHRPPMDLLLDATLEALADAGLTRDDIDGITTYPGRVSGSPGMSPLGIGDLRNALGLKTRWHCAAPEGPAQAAGIMTAAMAVATGQARHVIAFRALTESSSQTPERRASLPTGGGTRVGGWPSWLMPVYAMSAATWAGWAATRYFHEFGMTRDHLGTIAVNQRANAQGNPRALMHGKPMTIEEYHAARMITSPLGLFDCDVPIDGACVIIVSAADAARDCRKTPLRIEAMGAAMNEKETWDQQPDLTKMASHDAAADMWKRTDLKPKDVDVLQTYDGFSIFVPMWMEAFGFCKHGEAKDFIAAGHSAIGGSLPTNTGGGQLSAGRLHGFGHLHEACLQLWGEGGDRQVPGAKVAAVGMGGGPLAGAMLVARD